MAGRGRGGSNALAGIPLSQDMREAEPGIALSGGAAQVRAHLLCNGLNTDPREVALETVSACFGELGLKERPHSRDHPPSATTGQHVPCAILRFTPPLIEQRSLFGCGCKRISVEHFLQTLLPLMCFPSG